MIRQMSYIGSKVDDQAIGWSVSYLKYQEERDPTHQYPHIKVHTDTGSLFVLPGQFILWEQDMWHRDYS